MSPECVRKNAPKYPWRVSKRNRKIGGKPSETVERVSKYLQSQQPKGEL